MKTITTILKATFMPLSAFSFLIFGFMACFCSAFIEFIVLKELLSIPGSAINANAWATLIVFVLEGSKLTLHFYAEALKKQNLKTEIPEFQVEEKRKLINRVKYALVTLSLVCSMICVVNILYYNSEGKIQAAVEENSTDCEEKLDSKKANLEQERANTIAKGIAMYSTEAQHIENLQKRWNNLIDAIEKETSSRHREDLLEQANALYTELTEARTNYNGKIENITVSADKLFNSKLEKLESKYGENGSERLSADEARIAGDNTYLSNFLLAFTKTFGGGIYSRSIYFICTLLLAITVSVILELTISISQTLLTISVDSFIKIIGDLPPLDNGKKIVHFFTWLLFSVLISTSVYLICCIISQTTIGSENMMITILTYLGTVLLVNTLTPKLTHHTFEAYLPSKVKSANSIISKIVEILLEATIPAALAFVFCLLLGFLIKHNFDYTNFNALAVAIGGSFANRLKFKQFEFSV